VQGTLAGGDATTAYHLFSSEANAIYAVEMIHKLVDAVNAKHGAKPKASEHYMPVTVFGGEA
jgi:hypothetical protein